jgi:hypothetical protein
VKNFILFGAFAASSWQGMNLARVAVARMPEAEIDRMVDAGLLPPMKLRQPFVPITEYPEKYRAVPAKYEDAAELSQVRKSNGAINLNHFGYLAISRDFTRGAIYAITHYPKSYLRTVAYCCATYLRPTHDYFQLAVNKRAIQRYIDVTEFWRMGLWIDGSTLAKMTGSKEPFLSRPYALSSVFYVCGSLLLCIVFTAWSFRGGKERVGRMRYVYLWICGTLLFVAIIGNTMEVGENNRFRESVAALQFALSLVALHTLLSDRLAKAAGRLGAGGRRFPAPSPELS